ncbi:MAG: glycosyltransferase family 2 protein [Planctomycetota bacterium]
MPTPLSSIIVPVYNHGPYIGDCLESALAQDHGDLEVVVVDNQSTDDTWRVVQEIAGRDRRVRAYQNPANLGPVRNWLRGVEKARGTYGKILWSDDLIEPAYLSRTLPWLERGAAFVWTGAHIFDETPDRVTSTQFNEEPGGMLPSAE